jgi:hypothetical protein
MAGPVDLARYARRHRLKRIAAADLIAHRDDPEAGGGGTGANPTCLL